MARRAFELDAARTDAELGIGELRHGMEVTAQVFRVSGGVRVVVDQAAQD
ncbi:MAG: hypothetical protein ACLQDY_28845 [Streptosporangiaceae bacterium]